MAVRQSFHMIVLYNDDWVITKKDKNDMRERELLLEFYVYGWRRRICNGSKSCLGQNHSGAKRRRITLHGERIINNLYLNRLLWITRVRWCRTYTPHQVLPTARCSVVPYSVPCGRKQIARRKLRRIAPKTCCRYTDRKPTVRLL